MWFMICGVITEISRLLICQMPNLLATPVSHKLIRLYECYFGLNCYSPNIFGRFLSSWLAKIVTGWQLDVGHV